MIETVWLDNAPVNAVDAGIIDTLWNAFENLGDDVRAVVLRGRGERAFSAGADISGFVGGMSEGDRPGGIQPVADLIEAAPVPVVAARTLYDDLPPETVTLRRGDDPVVVSGPTVELALFFSGRSEVAQVELEGPDDAVARVREADLGF